LSLNKKLYLPKLSFLSFTITLTSLLLLSYSYKLQITNFEQYSKEAISNSFKQRKIAAPRGNIYDRNGILLASSITQNDLYILPYYFNNDLSLICDTIPINCKALHQKIVKTPFTKILIAQNIDYTIANNFSQINGLFISKRYVRWYNIESATTHIIGYIGKIDQLVLETQNDSSMYADDDFIGKMGLEYIYDQELHGINGAEQYIVMANGKELLSPNRFLPDKRIIIQPIKGNDLTLSIDDRLQLVLAKEIGFRDGAGVVMDVNTGAILAMYSSPSYDPYHVEKSFGSNNYPMINRTISGFAPGSTFKLITALAALELGIIKPTDTFNCPGYYVYGGRSFRCWKHSGHGNMTLHDAIMESCDVFFYKLSLKVGLDNIIKYAHLLGINEYTGIDLDGENKGSIVGKIAYKATTLNTVIGQGAVLVSPLQLARAYATIVNGGKLLKPALVMSSPVILKQTNFGNGNIDLLKRALYDVVNVEGGTGYAFRSKSIILGGKTGSSQKASLDKRGIKDNSWFVAFYPVAKPKIAICVFIENGEHGAYSIPIVNKVVEQYEKLTSR
jgi:penicillin-binding protein 2